MRREFFELEAEEFHMMNDQWLRVRIEWEPTMIDLEDDEDTAPVRTRVGIYNDTMDSPYTLEAFQKLVKSPSFIDNRLSNNNLTRIPIFSWKSVEDMSNVSSIGNISSYINTVFGSIDNFNNVQEETHRRNTMYKSVSFSDLSYDYSELSKPSCDSNVSCDSDVNVTVIFNPPKDSAEPTDVECQSTADERTSSVRFRNAKDFWTTLCQNVPPPCPEKAAQSNIMSHDNGYSIDKDHSEHGVISDKCTDVEAADVRSDMSFQSSAPSHKCDSELLFKSVEDFDSFVAGADMAGNSDNHEDKYFSICEESTDSVTESFNERFHSLPCNLSYDSLEDYPDPGAYDKYIKPPENDLQKNSSDRVLSEHQLRVQRSLQKLNLPDWYKNSPVPREGFLLKKRASDAGSGTRGWESSGLGSKTTSLGSLGGGISSTRSPLALTPPSQQLGFTRWSTSRLNSAQTSPCSSARSSVRGGAVSPLTSPARPPRIPRPTRAPYMGWRSQERLTSPRTPHERLAVSFLSQSPPVPANVSDEIQSSIKEVTSAIVHYVSGLEPNHERLNLEKDNVTASPRGSPRLCWLESSFVGTKPLESPQTPVVVAQVSPSHNQTQQRPLQLDLPSTRPTANGNVTLSTTTYQHDWQTPQHSLLNLAINKPSPGSTTLEDVLDSLLGLPSSAPRQLSPQNSPRRSTSPYYIVGLQNRFESKSERSNSQSGSLQLSLSSKTDEHSEYHSAINFSEDIYNSIDGPNQDSETYNRRRSSAESSSCSTLAPGMDGADREDSIDMTSLPKSRIRAKSVVSGKHSSRRQSEPMTNLKSNSLDRRVSYDSRISKGDTVSSKTSLSDNQQNKSSLKSIASVNTDGSAEDLLVHCRYTKCTSATTPTDARRNYKSCHNCSYLYCSRECRRAHWEKHRKICLHSRASSLCRQILATAKEDTDSLYHISLIAQRGYLTQGRGVVRVFFTSPDAAEKFTTNGFQSMGEPIYVKWPDLMSNEMGPELYAELVKLCKAYNAETRLVLYVAVCIVSEVPTKGATVKWERQIVSRCAKLRLSGAVIGKSNNKTSVYSSPTLKNKNSEHDDVEADPSVTKSKSSDTLILTSNSANMNSKNDVPVQKIREISFNNIQLQLQKRGVNLKRHYPEVYAKLCLYVDGTCDKFTPITIYPRDNSTGKSFMCVIMPETEPEKFCALPSDSAECCTVDVSIDNSDQVSTPM